MRLGGTVRKRAAIAGSAAIVSGVAAATVGLSAAPALADTASFDYTCSATLASTETSVSFVLGLTVNGAVATPPTAGDAVTLGGFQLQGTSTDQALETLLLADGVTTVTGAINDFPVSATADDGTSDGSTNPGTDNLLPVNATVGTDGALSFTTPASAISLSGFTANLPGAMNFATGSTFTATLDLSGQNTDNAAVSCTGGGPFATTTVADKAPPPPPPGTGTGGAGGGGGGGASPKPSPTHAGGTTAPPQNTGTENTTTNVTSARPTLASTGVSYTVPMTATGAALLLLGGGMLVAGRRRRDLVVEGPAEDGLTSEEPATED